MPDPAPDTEGKTGRQGKPATGPPASAGVVGTLNRVDYDDALDEDVPLDDEWALLALESMLDVRERTRTLPEASSGSSSWNWPSAVTSAEPVEASL